PGAIVRAPSGIPRAWSAATAATRLWARSPTRSWTRSWNSSVRKLLLLLLAPLAAQAQMQVPDYNWLGAGGRARPAYDGSAAKETELIPSIRYFGGPWFARTTQGMLEGGARVEVTRALHRGAQRAYEVGRKWSEAVFLASRNVPDIDPGASLGVHAEWDAHIGPAPTTLLARLRRLVESDRGAQAGPRSTRGVVGQGPGRAAPVFPGALGGATAH